MVTSSAAAVGFREDDFPADETVIFNQLPQAFPYAHSKFMAEIEVLKAVIDGLDCVMVNPAVVIGPGDVYQGSGSLLIEMKKGNVPAIPPGGVTLIDVRDVAAAHLAAAQYGRTAERYILGTVDMSHRAWMRVIADVIDAAVPPFVLPAVGVPLLAGAVDLGRRVGLPIPADGNQIRYSGRRVYFDCRKAWKELGEPQIDIRQSIQDTYDWYRAHGMI